MSTADSEPFCALHGEWSRGCLTCWRKEAADLRAENARLLGLVEEARSTLSALSTYPMDAVAKSACIRALAKLVASLQSKPSQEEP